MKRISAVILAAMMIFTVGCKNEPLPEPSLAESKQPQEKTAVVFTAYSPGSKDSVPTKTVIRFAQLVEEASDGEIRVNVRHSNELGNDSQAIENVRSGKIDIIFAGTSGFGSFYDKARVLDLPFLFDSAEQAYQTVNGEIGEAVFADFPKYGLVYLAEGDNGMRQLATTDRPVHTADDVVGLRLRVPDSQMYLDCWNALGAEPVALPLDELSAALVDKTAEGQDNAAYHMVANDTYRNIKYFSDINYMWMGCTMAANAVSWNKLTPSQQELVKQQAVAAAKYSFEMIEADNKAAEKVLEEAGVVFDREPDVQSFKDKLGGSEYYKRYANEPWYDQALVDSILNR